MKILNGKNLADEVLEKISQAIKDSKIKPGLVDIVIGNDPLSHKFADLKGRIANELGFKFIKKSFPDRFDPNLIYSFINDQNSDKSINGIIVQLPLPDFYRRDQILKSIHPFKDVDCLHPKNMGLLIEGHPSVIPPVVLGALSLINSTHQFQEKKYAYSDNEITIPDLEGINVVLIGAGILVGKPIAAFLMNQRAVVTIIDSPTPDLTHYTRKAQIIITGTNAQDVLNTDDVEDRTIVIDVGNDIDYQKFETKDVFLSKNPGGIGPLTVAYLMLNTIEKI